MNILEILELPGFQFSSLEKLQLHDATNLSLFHFTNIKITKNTNSTKDLYFVKTL